MSPLSPKNDMEPSEAIMALVEEFFERRSKGEDLSPQDFAAKHPEMTEQLSRHLAGLPFVERVCELRSNFASRVLAASKTELPKVKGFELIEVVGRGGMGVVYKALQLSTRRLVALKVISAGPFASESALRRFDREVRLAARLQHPGIVRVLEGGEASGQRYYAMDLVDGVRLDEYVASTRPDVKTVLGIFERICGALAYAHDHGVIHRDLKPGNILIDDEGHPHILDFGLAKATDQAEAEEAVTPTVSMPGQVLGTLFYLSPEQATGTSNEIDARTDVYALGVVLFEILTGSLPFDVQGRPSQVIQHILETQPICPSSLSDRVDDELEMIVLKALEKEKEQRYQSAHEMAEDVHRYLDGEPIFAKRPSGFYFLRKKVLKYRWGAAITAAMLAIVATGLVIGVLRKRQDLVAARNQALYLQHLVDLGRVEEVLMPARLYSHRYPQLPESLLVCAQVLYRSDQASLAIRYLEDRLKKDTSHWAGRALLAELYRATGDAKRADETMAGDKGKTPDTADAWYLRSIATLDVQTALHCAQEAVRREPSHRLACARLVRLYDLVGDYSAALPIADQLVKVARHPAPVLVHKAGLLARMGRFHEAIKTYNRALAADPGAVDVCRYRAHVYRKLGEHAKAVADYTKLIEWEGRETAYVWDLYQRASPLWMLGRNAEAVEDYRRVRALRARPSYADARRFLILRELKRADEAEVVLADALREVEDPWLERILRCLGNQVEPDELVADAIEGGNIEQLCEACYYAGEACLLADRLADARKFFSQCVVTGLEFDPDAIDLTPMNEYDLARWRLQTSFAEPTHNPPHEKN